MHSCNVFILHFSDTAEINIFVWGHAQVPMSPDIPLVDFSHEFGETYQVLVPHIIVPVSYCTGASDPEQVLASVVLVVKVDIVF